MTKTLDVGNDIVAETVGNKISFQNAFPAEFYMQHFYSYL